ncbi:hypothetical protein V2J09_004718 [Rumex salicifolius]
MNLCPSVICNLRHCHSVIGAAGATEHEGTQMFEELAESEAASITGSIAYNWARPAMKTNVNIIHESKWIGTEMVLKMKKTTKARNRDSKFGLNFEIGAVYNSESKKRLTNTILSGTVDLCQPTSLLFGAVDKRVCELLL